MRLNGFRETIVAAVIVLCLFAAGFTLGVVDHGLDAASTPLVTTVLALLGSTIAALLAVLKAERVSQKQDATNAKVDGQLSRMTEALLVHGVKPEELPPTPVAEQGSAEPAPPSGG